MHKIRRVLYTNMTGIVNYQLLKLNKLDPVFFFRFARITKPIVLDDNIVKHSLRYRNTRIK